MARHKGGSVMFVTEPVGSAFETFFGKLRRKIRNIRNIRNAWSMN